MIKALVKNKQTLEVTHEGRFETQEQAEAWFSEQELNKSFGEPAHQVNTADFGQPPVFVDVEAPYFVEYADISLEVAAAKRLADRKKKRHFGESLVDQIGAITDARALDSEQADALMMHPLVANIREHLWAGNIETAQEKIQTGDLSAFFSEEEKGAILAQISQFLQTL